MANPLSKITSRAKQIRRKSPGKSWKSAIKEAGRDYRAGRLGATLTIERNETRKTKPKKVVRVTRKKNGTFKKTETIGSAKAVVRSHAKEKLASLLFRRDQATTKRDKRKLSKQVAAARKEYKKYQ